MSSDMMTVTDHGDNYLKGTVDVSEAGVLVTSIPYEKGWSMKVDGKEREIKELIGGAFIATSLDEGTHEIQLKFSPPGLMAGIAVSFGAIALLTVLQILRKGMESKKKRRRSMRSKAYSEGRVFVPEESDYMKTT
jgi:uncharacterized membrane protein YfhO